MNAQLTPHPTKNLYPSTAWPNYSSTISDMKILYCVFSVQNVDATSVCIAHYKADKRSGEGHTQVLDMKYAEIIQWLFRVYC